MQVFKTYFKVMKKQLASIILYGIMFLAIYVLLSFTVFRDNSKQLQFNTERVPILLINEDKNSSLVDNFVTYLERFVTFEEIEEGEKAKKDALFNRKISYILTIPDGFTEDMLSGKEVVLTKQIVPDSTDAISVDTAVNNYLNTAKLFIKYYPGSSMEELNSRINSTMVEDTKVSIDARQKKTDLTSWAFTGSYYNYLGYILINSFILGIGSVMITFQKIEIKRKHFASPLTNRGYSAQLILANLVFVLCYLAVFITAGYFFNPSRTLDINLLLTVINVILFALTVLSLSYLISITVKGKNAIQALSTMLSLGLAFISGMFVPQQFLGEPVLKLASFTPSYWYVKANNTISGLTKIDFESISGVLTAMVIQLGFALAIISIALVVSKRKRQQAY